MFKYQHIFLKFFIRLHFQYLKHYLHQIQSAHLDHIILYLILELIILTFIDQINILLIIINKFDFIYFFVFIPKLIYFLYFKK